MQSEGKFIIQEPCHEDWTAMTPNEQGRFCAACQKCVIDLTNKQPAEIKEIYQANDGDVCGRMSVSQFVSTPQRSTDNSPFTSQVLKKLQVFALALLATFSFGYQTVQAQKRPIKGKIAHVPSDVRIEGQVKWDHGSAASGVTVEVWHGEELMQSRIADEKGKFGFINLERGQYRVVAKAGEWISAETQANTWQGGKFIVRLLLEDQQVDGGLGFIEEGQTIQAPETDEVNTDESTIYRPELECEVTPSNESETDHALYEPIELGKIAYIEEEQDVETVIKVGQIVDISDLIPPPIDPIAAESAEAEADADVSNAQSREEKLILNDIQFTIFPNPTDGELRVRIDSPSERSVHYLLYDMNGRSLAAHKWEPGMSADYEIDLSRYAAGTYLLRILSGEDLVEKRIVKR